MQCGPFALRARIDRGKAADAKSWTGTLPQACVNACICVNCAAMNRTQCPQCRLKAVWVFFSVSSVAGLPLCRALPHLRRKDQSGPCRIGILLRTFSKARPAAHGDRAAAC